MPGKPKMVWSICQNCKRPYKTAATELRKGRKFCSRSCATYSHIYQSTKNRNQDGANNPNWRGGRSMHTKGYVYVYAPDHPRASNGYVLEHILVAEKKLGRYLKDGETVHHINGVKWDNRPSNIQVFASIGEHTKFHFRQKARRKEAI